MATILFVDDDLDVHKMTTAVLREHGHDVLPALSGRKALVILERDFPVDVLVTDVMMPDMDGVTLARRAEALRPGLPTIFVTAYVDAMSLPMGGNYGFVRKPWRASTLIDAIDKLLPLPSPEEPSAP
jgi:two-component system cell cycle sensor histidine kinase/response regulator CckA